MTSPRFWIAITVGGFPYVAAAFFFLLWLFHVHDLRCVEPLFQYTTYTSVSVIVLSYIFGFSAHLLLQKLRWSKPGTWIFKRLFPKKTSEKLTAKKEAQLFENTDDYVLRHLGFLYATQVVYRLLFVGLGILAIVLWIWLASTEYRENELGVVICCMSLAVVMFIAWFFHREEYVDFESEALKKL